MSVALAVPFCDLRAAHAARAVASEDALLRVARSGRYVLGEEVEGFEDSFSEVCAVAQAVGVASGTDAIALILRAAGIGVGDEVVVPAYTAVATWMAIAQVGATPVGADVDRVSGLIDPAAAGAAIGPRTAALVAVHLFGRLAPMAALSTLAKRHGLLLIEDAAHSPGVDEGDGPAGSLGDAAAFSFYPTKPLGGLGDGGAVASDSGDLTASVRRLRSYGWSSWHGQTSEIGVNSRLDEVQAAVLRERLRELPVIHARLRRLASQYREALVQSPELAMPEPPTAGEPPWHQFVIRHSARDNLRKAIAEQGVGTALHYDPVPPALEVFGGSGEFPAARSLSASALSLPFDAWLTDDQVLKVCDAARAAAVAVRSPTESSGS